MIKDSIWSTLFFTGLILLHYILLPYLPAIEPKNNFALIYACLIAVNVIGITLFYFQRKLSLIPFAGMFLVFTTIQLLACMSFALAMKLMYPTEAKTTLIHFVVAFFVVLLVQSIYLVKKQVKQQLEQLK